MIFSRACQPYEKALTDSGYQHTMKFEPPTVVQPDIGTTSSDSQQKEKSNTRKRRITWFNPPFNANLKTNIGREFLSLISKCFPKDNKLNKICNKNTLKLSYSCLPNMLRNIQNHNKTLLKQHEASTGDKECNCRKKDLCPLKGKCLTKCVVYKATVIETNTNTSRSYIGLTQNEFKTRYNQHTSSFRLEHKKTSTSLSEHIWGLKNENKDFDVHWNIIKKCAPTVPTHCSVCKEEKLQILLNQSAPLNKRTECFSHCRHMTFALSTHKGPPSTQ